MAIAKRKTDFIKLYVEALKNGADEVNKDELLAQLFKNMGQFDSNLQWLINMSKQKAGKKGEIFIDNLLFAVSRQKQFIGYSFSFNLRVECSGAELLTLRDWIELRVASQFEAENTPTEVAFE